MCKSTEEVKIREYSNIIDTLGYDYIFGKCFREAVILSREKERSNRKIDTKVYLIRHGDTSYYKIGYSNRPYNRAKALTTGSPLINQVLYTSKLLYENTARNLERKLHHKFEEKVVRGEWFLLNNKDIEKLLIILDNPSNYSNEALMLNEIVFGIRDGDVRDSATEDQLDLISMFEVYNAGFIDIGMDYQARKLALQTIFNKRKQDNLLQ